MKTIYISGIRGNTIGANTYVYYDEQTLTGVVIDPGVRPEEVAHEGRPMRNGQLKPGYNLQLAVEGEYIVGVDIRNDRSDERTLLGLLDRMEAGYGKRHKNVIADAGYESVENYLGVRQKGRIAYIKPQSYEKSKTRKYRTNALRENMPYNAQTLAFASGRVMDECKLSVDGGLDEFGCAQLNIFGNAPIFVYNKGKP